MHIRKKENHLKNGRGLMTIWKRQLIWQLVLRLCFNPLNGQEPWEFFMILVRQIQNFRHTSIKLMVLTIRNTTV